MMYMASGGNTPTATQMALVISDNHGFKVGRSGYDGSDFDVSPTAEYFRVTNTGLVGIGTNSPQTKLHLRQTTDNNTDGFRISRTNSAASYSQYIDTSARFNIGYSNPSTADPSPQITLDQGGAVLIGENAPRSYVDGAGYTQTPKLQVEADDNTSSAISLTFNSAAGAATRRASFMFARTADGTAVADNSVLGEVLFMGEGNSTLEKAASIRAEVDGTPGTNDMPGRLVFSTSADGSDSPAERLRITAGGQVGIGTVTPNSLLHLHQSSTSGFDGLRLTNSTTGVSATSGFSIELDNTEGARIWHYGNENISFGVDNELSLIHI